MRILSLFLASVLGVSFGNDYPGCRPNEDLFINGLDNPIGDIYSPGYKEGKNYSNDMYCAYIIGGPPGYRVKLIFKDMDIEPSVLCGRDVIEIAETTETIIGGFCGNVTVRPVLSEANTLAVRFTSDFIVTRPGFHLQYQVSNTMTSLCEKDEELCRNRNCYPVEKKCDGRDDCGDGTDEENCGYPLPVTECGTRVVKDFGQDRVIGGKEAIPGSWPWQAGLHLSDLYPNGATCGGTLINAQWVLSAAHCFQENKKPSEWRIHLGKHNKFIIDESEQIRFVERIIVYPDFTGEKLLEKKDLDMNHDYALLKLNAPVKFTNQVRPACLPSQGYELQVGQTCWSSGWGVTRGTGLSDVLKEVDLTVVDKNTCRPGPSITENMICTRNEKGFQDLCSGDSGGPYVCEFNDKWYIMGITSFGTVGNGDGSGLCGVRGTFGVFSKVSAQINWIKEQINKYG